MQRKLRFDFVNFHVISYLKLKIVMQIQVVERHECIYKMGIFVL